MRVRPRNYDDTCHHANGLDPAGKIARCHRAATMRLDDIPYCDGHAEPLMAAYCERPVKIERASHAK